MFFKRMITVAIAFDDNAFAIWGQVFTLMRFQVFPFFLFRHFHPNYLEVPARHPSGPFHLK